MKISFVSILLLIVLASCRKDVKKETIETDSTIYFHSDSLHAIVFKPNHRLQFFNPDTSMSIMEMWPILGADGWVPDKSELLRFKNTFTGYWQLAKTDSLAKLNNLTPILWKRIDVLDYQIVGFFDSLKTKKILVNIGNWDELGSPDSDDWKTDWIIINDTYGGSFYSIYNSENDSIEVLEWH